MVPPSSSAWVFALSLTSKFSVTSTHGKYFRSIDFCLSFHHIIPRLHPVFPGLPRWPFLLLLSPNLFLIEEPEECFTRINNAKSVLCFKCSSGFPSYLKQSSAPSKPTNSALRPLLTYPTLSFALPLLLRDHKDRVGPQNKYRGSTWQRDSPP